MAQRDTLAATNMPAAVGFGDLPKEVLVAILSELDVSSLVACKQVRISMYLILVSVAMTLLVPLHVAMPLPRGYHRRVRATAVYHRTRARGYGGWLCGRHVHFRKAPAAEGVRRGLAQSAVPGAHRFLCPGRCVYAMGHVRW